MPAHYFLGNRLLGSSPRTPWWDSASLAEASVLFVCPVCGDAWGRVVIEGKEWVPLRRGCAKHPWNGSPGGTFIPSWLHRYDHLPDQVLRYELNLLLNQPEFNHDQSQSI